MMDHSEARRQNTEHWAACQHNIVRFLSQHLDTEFSEDEVNHVIGLIEVNAFEVKLGPATSVNDFPELGCREIVYYLIRGVLLTQAWVAVCSRCWPRSRTAVSATAATSTPR